MKSVKQPFLILLFLLCLQTGFGQSATELQTSARTFMQQGDYANAVLVLKKAVELAPQDIEIAKDLAMGYYLQRDNNKALEVIKPLLDREDADDQCYQIAGNIYQQLNLIKDCDKLYRKGISQFPASGALYNELGLLLYEQKDITAIQQWEKGIEADPNYSKNYYNAGKYYYGTPDKVWSILYGEIFVNMEPLNSRTPEIKSILSESYKKLFADNEIYKSSKGNPFTAAFIETMLRQSTVALSGINAESITMIRTRFILDWYQNYAAKFPFRLFNLQQQLLQDGLFDAYNQWIFGSVQNLAAYQTWTVTHSTDYNDFSYFQKGRIFKLPAGQYYRYR